MGANPPAKPGGIEASDATPATSRVSVIGFAAASVKVTLLPTADAGSAKPSAAASRALKTTLLEASVPGSAPAISVIDPAACARGGSDTRRSLRVAGAGPFVVNAPAIEMSPHAACTCGWPARTASVSASKAALALTAGRTVTSSTLVFANVEPLSA